MGAAGQLLNAMLSESGIRREECFLSNVVNSRPPANQLQQWFEPGGPRGEGVVGGLRPGAAVVTGVERLFAQLDAVQPRVVVALGNYALWALTQHAGSAADGPRPRVPTGIGDWRGSQVFRVEHGVRSRERLKWPGTPVLPVLHPAAILRDWSARAVAVHDLRTRVPLALAGTWSRESRNPPYQFTAGTDLNTVVEQLQQWLAEADSAASSGASFELSYDIETWKSSLITCVGIAPDSNSALSIPLVRLDETRKGAIRSFWSPEQEAQITQLLARLLNHPGVGGIGQNFLYDRAFLWEWWRVEPRLSWDTLVAQNLLLPGTPKDLGHLASLYCKHYRWWKKDGRDWTDDAELGLETHLLYNAEDCARTFEVRVEQERALREIRPDSTEHPEGRFRLWQPELAKIRLAWEMQRRGVRVDQQRRARLALDLIEARAALAVWLEAIAPQEILDREGVTPKSGTRWFDSPRQTAALVYEVLGLRVQRNRKTGAVSTDDEACNTLKELYPRLVALFESLLEYRSIGVLYSTFVEAKLEADGKFHASFNPAGTVTFRFSSGKNPFRRGGNLQNIPAGDET